jgi:hypothetical protein
VSLSTTILVLGILTSLSVGMTARTDPRGRIRTILLGDVIDQYGGYNSFTVIGYDPAIEVTLIPSVPQFIGGYDNAQRNLRVYMPRTYEILVERYHLTVFSDADRLVFKPEWIHWLSSSVTDGGLGMLWLGSITAPINLAGWEDTTVAEVLPARQPEGEYTIITSFFMKILDNQEPLMQALPWEEAPPLMNVYTPIGGLGLCVYYSASYAGFCVTLGFIWEGRLVDFKRWPDASWLT